MRTRDVVSLVTAGCLALGALGAPAAGAKRKKPPKRVERTVEATYDSPAVGNREATGVCFGSNGCAMIGVGPTELYLSLKIEDATGTPVPATVGQDLDPGDNFVDVVARICGETLEPILITPGLEVTVWLWATPGLIPPCAGIGTTGTVTATLSNLP